nr:basic proline-rich protein-like [Aegilops tauschii subsp. strangulata]
MTPDSVLLLRESISAHRSSSLHCVTLSRSAAINVARTPPLSFPLHLTRAILVPEPPPPPTPTATNPQGRPSPRRPAQALRPPRRPGAPAPRHSGRPSPLCPPAARRLSVQLPPPPGAALPSRPPPLRLAAPGARRLSVSPLAAWRLSVQPPPGEVLTDGGRGSRALRASFLDAC